MTQADMRSFLRELSEKDWLVSVAKTVSPSEHIGAFIFDAQALGKAILFESVSGSSMRCVANLVGSRDLVAHALGVDRFSLVEFLLSQQSRRVPPVLTDEAPVHDEVHRTDALTLEDLPVVTHGEKDVGPYLTAGLVVARYPDSKERNVSFHRMMVRGPTKVGVRLTPSQDLDRIHAENETRGEGTKVAVALGNHPIELIAGATSLPFGNDEFELAGALRGEALELVKCQTVDLEVPAHCEIVLEGEILPGVRKTEGPFGDFMQFYIPPAENHVLRVDAITHRTDPIYQAMHAGAAEDMGLLALPREIQLTSALKQISVDVVDVSYLPTVFGAVVSINQRYEDEAKQVIATAFGRHRWLKFCVVVDDDVDILDMEDVWWALVTRSRFDRGTVQIEPSAGFPRDEYGIHKAKLGIDATIPYGTWDTYQRKRPPGYGSVKLSDFL